MRIRFPGILALVVVAALSGGCASSISRPGLQSPAALSAPSAGPGRQASLPRGVEAFRYHTPKRLKTPLRNPRTPGEYLEAGGAWAMQGGFHKAAVMYDAALPFGASVETERKLLFQAACCYLLALEYRPFHDRVERLKETYSAAELLALERADRKTHALLRVARNLEDR